jgi:SAM-dependent MidA family methyltransferase
MWTSLPSNASSKTPLPPPSESAQQRSRALLKRIAYALEHNGGWLPFDRYMDIALYTPGLGYYSGQDAQFGSTAQAGSDFTTAPEISPFFGQALAQAIAQALQASATTAVMEFGAGTGKLAVQVLQTLEALGVPCTSYAILEVSAHLRARQKALLEKEVPQYLDRITWLDTLPTTFEGVAFGNEVLDAMPVKLFALAEGGWFERGIRWSAAAQTQITLQTASAKCDTQDTFSLDMSALDLADALTWEDRLAPENAELTALRTAINQARTAHPDAFSASTDYLTESHQAATAFIGTVCTMLRKGALFFIDYGFPAHEYYHAQRNQGTLMCHYQHHAHTDPLWYPGLQDITTHIDFSAIAQAAEDTGISLLGYTSQARFLLNCGILKALDQLDPRQSAQFLPAANGIQKLLAETEMGELFKVIAWGRGLDADMPFTAFAQGDRSHRL